jgi:hypothetical protein
MVSFFATKSNILKSILSFNHIYTNVAMIDDNLNNLFFTIVITKLQIIFEARMSGNYKKIVKKQLIY